MKVFLFIASFILLDIVDSGPLSGCSKSSRHPHHFPPLPEQVDSVNTDADVPADTAKLVP